MSPQAEEPDRDEPLPEHDPSEVEDPDATDDGSHVQRDPDATVDAVPANSDAQTQPNSESANESPDPDATYIPSSVVQKKVKEWESSLSEDSEPGHTLKPRQTTNESAAANAEHSVVLKRRDVSRQDKEEDRSTADESDQPDYRTDKLLGEGGMGAVFSATQQSMDRPVAIKVLKPRAARLKSSRQAFVSEAIITGGLDHPNIVPIYDVGKQADDALFYAMKQVEGVEWKERLATNSVDENLEILLRVSDAVAFGHARCIIHRDLKPANIMLGEFGEVLVMDWGLAMPSDDHPRRDSFPRAKRGGTPHYMAPEMANDPMLGVDRRSDVYLLGAILFEIVTGKPPHAIESLTGSRRERVKACLAAVAQNVIAETDASGELVEIARKAMATAPENRYQTVPEFQKAVREYLSHEESIELTANASRELSSAIQTQIYDDFSRARFGFEQAVELWAGNNKARAGRLEACLEFARCAQSKGDFDLGMSLLDRSESEHDVLFGDLDTARRDALQREQQLAEQKRARARLRKTLTATAVVALVIVTCLGAYSEVQRRDAVEQRGLAETNAQTAEQRRQEAEGERQKAVASREKTEATLARSNFFLAQARWDNNRVADARELLLMVPEQHRNVEWNLARRQFEGSDVTFYGHTNGVTSVNFSPDGTHIASGSRDQTIRLWDASTGEELNTLKGHAEPVYSVSFSPDGTLIASGSNDQTIKLWDASTGEELDTLTGHTGGVKSVIFSPDGTLIASGSDDLTIRLWNASTGEELHTLTGRARGSGSVIFSPDGTLIASGGLDQTIKLWDASTGDELHTLKGHADAVFSLSFSPDGTRIASGSMDQTIGLWDASTGEELHTLTGHTTVVRSVNFSPDGTLIASGSLDGTIRLWNASTGEELHTFKGHIFGVTSVSFSPDGSRIASGSWDMTIRLWDALRGEEFHTPLKGQAGLVTSVSFSPDGSRIAAGGLDQTIRLWDASTGDELHTLKGHTNAVDSVNFSPDGTRIASGSRDQTIKLWDASTGEELNTLKGHAEPVFSVSFSPDGTRIASGSVEQTIRLWDASTGEELHTLKGHTNSVTNVSFSPDCSRIASGSWDQTIRLWDASTGEELNTLEGHTKPVTNVSFSSDGSRIASGSADRTLRLWDVSTGEELHTLKGHTNSVTNVSFSPDGTRIVSASSDRTIRLWDTSTGEEVYSLKGHKSSAASVSFSRDSTRIASVIEDSTIRLWDATMGAEVYILKGHTDVVNSVSFSPDGTRIVSGSADRTLRLWDVSTGEELHTLKGHTKPVVSVSFSLDGTRLLSQDWENLFCEKLIWEVESGEVLPDGNVEEFPAADASSKTLDGRWFAIPSMNDVVLVDLAYKKTPRELQRRKLLARPKPRWHRNQFVAARSAKRLYAAVFHAAWLLKITPSGASLHDDLHETHRQLLAAHNGQDPPLPAVVVEMLKLPRGNDLPTEAKN